MKQSNNFKKIDKFLMKKIAILIIGLIVMTLGISLYLKAEFGADPITTFVSGVSVVLNISVGNASLVSMTVLMLVVFFIDKQRIGIGTFANTFLTGILLNIFMGIIPNYSNLTYRLSILVMGVIFFAVGLTLFIISKLGEGPVDLLMLIFKDKNNINIEKSRLVTDVVLITSGFLMGAKLGVGTIIGTFLTGILMGQILKINEKRQFLIFD